jgi:hypothetical protein
MPAKGQGLTFCPPSIPDPHPEEGALAPVSKDEFFGFMLRDAPSGAPQHEEEREAGRYT